MKGSYCTNRKRRETRSVGSDINSEWRLFPTTTLRLIDTSAYEEKIGQRRIGKTINKIIRDAERIESEENK